MVGDYYRILERNLCQHCCKITPRVSFCRKEKLIPKTTIRHWNEPLEYAIAMLKYFTSTWNWFGMHQTSWLNQQPTEDFIFLLTRYICVLDTFVNCGHLKFLFTAPWLKNLVEYSYLLPKYSVKILRDKKWAFSFYFTFCKRGILHVSLWRVAL